VNRVEAVLLGRTTMSGTSPIRFRSARSSWGLRLSLLLFWAISAGSADEEVICWVDLSNLWPVLKLRIGPRQLRLVKVYSR
jgi:hypothetical protein